MQSCLIFQDGDLLTNVVDEEGRIQVLFTLLILNEMLMVNKGPIMKKIFIAFMLVIPFMIGCSDSSVNPQEENQSNRISQTSTSNKSWISLPENDKTNADSEYSASEVIDGEAGGIVELNVNYVVKGSVNVKIDASIEVPAGAYSDQKNIIMKINSINGTATFYPSPETFNKPLVFNLKISGIDLNGVNPKTLDYVYLAPDGSFQQIGYKKIVINNGILIVEDALIPHFSIYGWCR